MAFSSRTPRSHRKRAVLTRSGARSPRSPAKHLRLWEAIRQTREELDQWQQRAEQVELLFREHILPRETRFTSAYSELTNRLMDRFEEGALNSARQALLVLWITDNLHSLNAHPFVSQTQRAALSQRWQAIQIEESNRANVHSSMSGQRKTGSLRDALDEDELDEDDVIFDFGWHNSGASRGKAEDDALPENDDFNKGQHGRQANRRDAHGQARSATDGSAQADGHIGDAAPDVDAKVSELEKRLSIDRLFRQLARVLHPDLEQDEALKAEKHELMSQCLQARQDKDINTLLTLYCQHVGDLPDDLSATDHDDLIKALQMQLRQLQNELRQERFSDPLRAQIVERYSDGDEQQTLQRVMHHAESLDAESEHLDALRQSLDSDESLIAALDARREIELDRLVINQMTGYS